MGDLMKKHCFLSLFVYVVTRIKTKTKLTEFNTVALLFQCYSHAYVRSFHFLGSLICLIGRENIFVYSTKSTSGRRGFRRKLHVFKELIGPLQSPRSCSGFLGPVSLIRPPFSARIVRSSSCNANRRERNVYDSEIIFNFFFFLSTIRVRFRSISRTFRQILNSTNTIIMFGVVNPVQNTPGCTVNFCCRSFLEGRP